MEKHAEIDFLQTLLPVSVVLFIIALGVVLLNQQFNKNLYRQRLQHEETKNKNQQELLRVSIHSQEEERKRIARDLHDELGTTLSLMRMQLVQLEENPDDPKFREKLSESREITETAIASIRRISHVLLPPQLAAFGLIQTLQVLCKQVTSLNRIDCSLTADSHFPRLPATMELGLYRVCLELIQNTIKHAAADTIRIQLSLDAHILTFLYSDNGKGFPEKVNLPGLGHKNIEARIQALNGLVEMGNRKENGMFAQITIPLENNG